MLATYLAELVAALHRIDPTESPVASRGVPLEMRDPQTHTAIGALGGMVGTTAAAAAWDAALQTPGWHGPPVWTHGDLSPGNVLCVHERLSAVIDFGGVVWAIPSAT